MLYRIIIFLFAFGYGGLSHFALAQPFIQDNITRAVEAELASLNRTYKVTYADSGQLRWLKSAFHDLAFEINKDQQYAIVTLDDDQLSQLQNTGFVVELANEYIKRREIELQRILDSRIKISQSSSSINGESLSFAMSAATASVSGILGFPCYETVEETYAVAQDLADSYPALASLIDIGDSWEKTQGLGGYDLLVLKITNSEIQQNKPILFIHSAMHARELTTAALTLAFAKELLTKYGSDADVSWVVDYREIHILFHMNPDGRKLAEIGLNQRKNTNTTHCFNDPAGFFGVDLNRNFGAFWNAGGFDFYYNRASFVECHQTYRGPFGSSEPETQAVEMYIRSLYPDNRGPNDNDAAPADTQGLHIDVHSSGGDVLYPWGHSYEPPPNQQALATLARKIAIFNRYDPKPANGIYLLDGNSESVSYGELGIPQLTFELGTKFREDCALYEDKIKPDNLQALLYAAKVAEAPYQLPSGPEVINLAPVGDVYGRVNIGDSVPLAATAIDSRYRPGVQVLLDQFNQPILSSSGSRQFETVQEPFEQVMAAEYSIDIPPTEVTALAYSMAAEDFLYDESEELVQADLMVLGLESGKHTLLYRAQDSNGQWGAISAQFFEVKDPLQPQFGSVCTGNICQFFGDRSLHYDGTITNYHWDFGNGQQSNAANPNGVIYPVAQAYQVTLTVTDDQEHSVSTSGTVYPFFSGAPVANIAVNCNELTCQFDASGSSDLEGAIANYQWTFNKTDQVTGVVASYTFTSLGNQIVELVVSDQSGFAGRLELTVSLMSSTASSGSGSGSSGGGGSMSLFTLFCMLLAAMFKGRTCGINLLPNSIKIQSGT